MINTLTAIRTARELGKDLVSDTDKAA